MIRFHRWKVVGHRVLDEDDFIMNVTGGQYRFNRVATDVGTQGPVTNAADFVEVEMCGVKLGYTNGITRARVVVTVKIEPSTG